MSDTPTWTDVANERGQKYLDTWAAKLRVASEKDALSAPSVAVSPSNVDQGAKAVFRSQRRGDALSDLGLAISTLFIGLSAGYLGTYFLSSRDAQAGMPAMVMGWAVLAAVLSLIGFGVAVAWKLKD